MIEITGPNSKSKVVERLRKADTLIICVNPAINLRSLRNSYEMSPWDKDTPTFGCLALRETIFEFLKPKFKVVVIYTNLWHSEVMPILNTIQNLEKSLTGVLFIVTYRRMKIP